MEDSVFAENVSKYIPSYPSIEGTPDFSFQIARKKEFYDLRLFPSEEVPKIPGTPLLSQELQSRFFSPNTNFSAGLLFQGVGTGKCVLPDTLILTSKGKLKAKDIWKNYSINDKIYDDCGEWSGLFEDIEVSSFNGKNFEARKINKLYRQYISEEVVNIFLDNESYIRLTRAHHLFNGKSWTNKFSIGDIICVSKNQDERIENLTERKLLGSKIKFVTYSYYEGFVYDFEILDTHNYVANDILCHNTCTSSLIVEHFKSTLVGGEKRKPALVIVPNETLARSYRNEVANRCTKEGIYLPKLTQAELKKAQEGEAIEMSDITQEKRLRSAIAKSYEIVTYEQFFFMSETTGEVDVEGKSQKMWKMVKRLPDNPDIIRRKFNNRVIIIDEAHNLRIQPGKKKKESILDIILKKEPGVSIEMYQEIHRFLHIVQNCRIILLTGTPIWDKVYEIASLMNLILPENEQLPVKMDFIKEYFDDSGKLIPEKAKFLKDRFRGRVSYLRPMITTAKREEIGVRSPWLKYIKVYPSAMSQFQYQFAKKSMEDTEKVEIKYKSKTGKIITTNREIKGGALRKTARDAANFVFPVFKKGKYKIEGGYYGKEAFNKYIESQNKGKSYKYRDILTEKAVRENLRDFSCKFAAAIQEIKNHPNELVFIYNEFVKSPGGVINLALVLRAHGFEWAKRAMDIKKPGNKRRFVVISSDPSTTNAPKQIEELINSFNKEDNKYGERCQIIIGSKKIAEGVTIKNVRQFHDLTPHWNTSSNEQASGRVFRVGSHDSLPKEERYIKIYRHVAVKEFEDEPGEKEYNKGLGYPSDVGFTDDETIDVYIYKIAENKEVYSTQIYRLLKEISWDCPLNYKRNVLESDQDFSRPCDYMECNYRCDGFPENYIEKSNIWEYKIPEKDILKDTYNLFYSNEDILRMTKRIQDLFGVYFSLRLDLIGELLDIDTEEENDLLMKALDIIINIRIQIKNRYGFGSYLKEEGNTYFLDNNVSTYANYPENTYINMPLITERSSLEEIVEIDQLNEDKKLIQKFCVQPKEKSYLLDRMNYRTLIILLEKIQEIKSSKSQSKLTSREKEAIDVIMKEIGRNLIKLPDGKIIHNMYTNEYTGVGYNVAVQEIKPTGLVRVFDPQTLEWNYASPKEEESFIVKLKEESKTTREDLWKDNPYGVYGFRDKTGKFKIRIKPEEGKKDTKGSVCMEVSWNVNKLYNLFNKLGVIPPPSDKYKEYTREELVRNIEAQPSLSVFRNDIDSKNTKELQGILTLYSMDKKQMCNFLEEWFKENELFYDLKV